MENCLVTRLRGTVDADLPTLGEITFKLAAGKTNVNSNFGPGAVISLVSGEATATMFGQATTFPITCPTDYHGVGHVKITTTTACVFSVKSKYVFECLPECIIMAAEPINTELFQYSPIQYFGVPSNTDADNTITGDIAYIFKLQKAGTGTKIELARCNHLRGNIAALGRVMNSYVNEITIFKTALSGSIEEFVAAARQSGLTSSARDVSFPYMSGGSNVTFQGVKQTGASNTLSWTATTITFNSVTITA